MSNFSINSKSSKSTSRKSRAISIRECADDKIDPIPDLCNFVKGFNTPNTTPGGKNELAILQSEQKKYKLENSGSQNQETRDTVSLDELTSPDKSSMPRGDRISLAVRLAYAIIQYYSTGWIDPEWTWKDFSVTGSEYKYSDVSQLFVSQKFYSTTGKATKRPMWVGWESLGEPKLTRKDNRERKLPTLDGFLGKYDNICMLYIVSLRMTHCLNSISIPKKQC
jgi:hypothetical protein